MLSSVADLVTMISFISPASLPTRAQAELMVSFTRSILSEIFAIEKHLRNQETQTTQNSNIFKISILAVFASIKKIKVKILTDFLI
jgi:hypothetical protein